MSPPVTWPGAPIIAHSEGNFVASAGQPEVEPKRLERGVAKSSLSLAGTVEDSPARSVWNDAQSVHDMSLNLGSPVPDENNGHESSAHVLPTPGVPSSVSAARHEESSPAKKKVIQKEPRDKLYFRSLGIIHTIQKIYVATCALKT